MNEFDVMDEVEVPDQWDDIVERSEHVVTVEPALRIRHRRVLGGAIAAGVLVLALAGALLIVDRSGGDETVAVDTDPRAGSPVLSCVDGELAAGSIPEDAEFGSEPLYTASMVDGVVSWSWGVGEQIVQLNVRGIPWAEEGRPVESVADPRGTFVVLDVGARFTGFTGLGEAGACGTYDVMVAGGSDEENRQVALEVASALRWVPIDPPEYPDFTDEDSVRRWAVAHAPSVEGLRPPPVGGSVRASGRVALFEVDVDSIGPWDGRPVAEWFDAAPGSVVWVPMIQLDPGYDFKVDDYSAGGASLTPNRDPSRLAMFPAERDDDFDSLVSTPILLGGS